MIEVDISSCGRLPVIFFVFETMHMAIIPNIAPVEATPINPKLSFSDAWLSFFNFETPTARAKINGTVSAPSSCARGIESYCQELGRCK